MVVSLPAVTGRRRGRRPAGASGTRRRDDPGPGRRRRAAAPARPEHQPARPRATTSRRRRDRRRGARGGGRRTRRTSSSSTSGCPTWTASRSSPGCAAGPTCPILVLSGRTDSADKVEALDAGADDYVTKPFGMDELLARLRAMTRRGGAKEDAAGRPASATPPSTSPRAGCTVAGADVRLTPTEWHLLEVLVRHPGKLLSQRQLLTEVWGPGLRDRAGQPARSTWPSCAASSSPTRPARATCSPSPAWATASSREPPPPGGRPDEGESPS